MGYKGSKNCPVGHQIKENSVYQATDGKKQKQKQKLPLACNIFEACMLMTNTSC